MNISPKHGHECSDWAHFSSNMTHYCTSRNQIDLHVAALWVGHHTIPHTEKTCVSFETSHMSSPPLQQAETSAGVGPSVKSPGQCSPSVRTLLPKTQFTRKESNSQTPHETSPMRKSQDGPLIVTSPSPISKLRHGRDLHPFQRLEAEKNPRRPPIEQPRHMWVDFSLCQNRLSCVS